ncbi:MAG: HAMP domain-containing histidine kinase [Gammaproteobacteria bacterium]|nr:HAMP domain-containing histidine kinase [Gammaproteobacteria bacterium]MDH3750910.1 HAMP domain-containing histidine kinase [Gammaproteobacteria bacterium]
MLPKTLIKGFDKGRLRNLLVLFFLALAVPTTVLIWQAYSQLKWEAFHQYRGDAEELTRRIDTRLNEMIRTADARSFADYTFLVVSGDPSANFVQRSPLSAYPVTEDLPGVLGYFQVDTAGTFSTPLLPPSGSEAVSFGISADEYSNRLQLAQEINTVLADNRLVQLRQETGMRRRLAASFAEPETVPEEEKEADEYEAGAVGGFRDETATDDNAVARTGVRLSEAIVLSNEGYSQQVFDQLNQPKPDTRYYSNNAGPLRSDHAAGEASQTEQRLNRIGKVSDLKLDADLQKKSEEAEREDAQSQLSADGFAYAPGRSKRTEQIALPESAPVTGSELMVNVTGPSDLRISTFESEIDPFEFSLLDSGHFVLFRKVWRDGQRYIQGLLVDQETFTQEIIGARFMDTALSDMSNLIIAFQDDVIRTFGGRDNSGYPDVAADLDGALLYRNRLTAPLGSLEFIFSIKRLPPGPGASVLGWVTLVLAIVFVGGFVTLYRMGLSQINLARQQQDFVSAVSHELKSPLTSIRMYGEMLKEGWADEEKRQSYYEFIHDESERLSRLISNVLQLARITRNEPQFDLKPTKVAELMSNTESKISSQIERAGFELKFNSAADADQATINIDEDCFAQIIINLVDNAIKFSSNAEHKAIEISSKLSGDSRILFSVRDYGPGIPKDQMKKIFQLFYRSESELTRETVGTGIGLAIVHQLTVAMNGSVDMTNVEPGAEFRIWFSIVD